MIRSIRCATWPVRCVLLAVAVGLARGAGAAEAKPRKITMKDGRTFIGQVVRGPGSIVVKTPDQHIYLSRAFVAREEPVEGYRPPPVYTFNTKTAATEKKGKIAGVVQNVVWGRFDAAGKSSIKLTDPKLGKVSYTMAIVKITPVVCRLEGVEYEHTWSFPLGTFGGLPGRMVLSKTDKADAGSLLKAARFFRMAGRFSTASGMLKQLQAAGGDPQDVKAERANLQAAQLRQKVIRAGMLLAAGRHAEAVRYVNALGAPEGLARSHPKLVAEAEAAAETIAADIRTMFNARKLLAERKLPADGLTLDQARRLVKALRPGSGKRPTVSDPLVLRLAEKWAEPLAGMGLTDKVLQEAADLADGTAEFFRQGQPMGSEELARKFAASRLPLKLKLSIFRYAARFRKTDKPVAWEKVAFKHPRTGKGYHYYVQMPSNYHPGRPTPALLSLHGQLSTAEAGKRVWGRRADKLGMILISPEYIYGRKWGYHFSVEEHEAVLGALSHAAARFHIDMDRVFLQGTSQGGHACWDTGAGHAGRFAGIIPIIGAPRVKASYPNFHDVPVYSVGGEKDAGAPVYNRAWARAVTRVQCDATYVEYLARGHEGFSEEYDRIGRWMLKRARPRPAKRITLVALRGCDCRRRWVRVRAPRTRLGETLVRTPIGRVKVTAFCNNNVFTATVTNVKRIQFFFPPELVDFARPVTINVNSRRRLSRFFKPDWAFALEEGLRRRDRARVYLGQATIDL